MEGKGFNPIAVFKMLDRNGDGKITEGFNNKFSM